MSSEFRKNHRVEGHGTIKCNGVEGELVNLSRHGIAFTTEETMESVVETLSNFTVEIVKSDVFQEAIQLELKGIIRHCRFVESEQNFINGVALDSLSEDQQIALDKYLAFQWDSQLFWDDDLDE